MKTWSKIATTTALALSLVGGCEVAANATVKPPATSVCNGVNSSKTISNPWSASYVTEQRMTSCAASVAAAKIGAVGSYSALGAAILAATKISVPAAVVSAYYSLGAARLNLCVAQNPNRGIVATWTNGFFASCKAQ